MKPQIIFKFFIIFLFFISITAHAQYVQKRAGVCFREDDNHPKEEFRQYAAVFDKYGFKFCYALNLGLVNPTDTGFINTIDTLIAHGHEMMDHTPNHNTKYFTVRSLADTVLYSMSPGVDHINQKTIYLKIDSLHPNNYGDEGPIIINGNRIISVLPGEFKNFTINKVVNFIYLPVFNKILSYYSLSNTNVNDPDTIYLKTFWDEPYTSSYSGITSYKKLGIQDVFLNKMAIFYLFNQTKNYSNEFHFPPPTTWIQPGGNWPYFSAEEIKNVCNLLGYNAAGIWPTSGLKYFNEYDPFKINRYHFHDFDFNSETQTFKTIKPIIANAIAKNKVLIETNHFGHYAQEPLLGGWTGYLNRIDSILSWCKDKNIPVRTYRDWVPLLNDSIPNPYQNVFPPFANDFDEDGYPDGFNKIDFGTISANGGAQLSDGYYIKKTTEGYLCSIADLGGIEKGINQLELYTKGDVNNKIFIYLNLTESNQYITYTLQTNTNYWKKQKIEFNCPDSITTISLKFYNANNNANIKLSGISLRKKSIITALPDTTIFTTFDSKFKTASLKDRVYDPLYSKDSLTFSVVKTTGLTTSIDSLQNLIVSKPTPFWRGTDTAWVKVQNPDGDDDTLRVIFKAISPVFCKGDTIILKPNFQITPSQITLASTPTDSTLIPKSFGLFTDVPDQTTRYFVKGIMPLGNIVSDSIDISIVAMLQPILSIIGNNPFCPADSIQIIASPNNYKTKWYCNDLLIPGNDSLANYHTSKSGNYYAIQYDQNGCKNSSAILTIEKYLKLEYNINTDTSVCINIDSLQLFSQFTNPKSVSWSTSGDGILTILPNQNLIYHPGTSDRVNGSTFLSVVAEGLGNCSIITDTIKIHFTPIPSKPSIPIGLDSLCINSPNSVFTCNGGTNAIYSEWAITPGNAGTINNSSISYALIDWNNSFSGKAFLSVSAVNQCGTSNSSDTLSIEIIPIPGKADLPTGLSQICQNSIDQIFTTLGTSSASHYQWNIIPANAANLTGNSNNTVAHFNSGFIGAAAITVQGVNNCGIGAVSDTFNLNIKPLPTKPSIPLGQTQLCINSNNSLYTTSGSNYASAYQWNIFPETAGIIIDSASTSFINWDSSFFGISKLIVKGTNECGSKSSDTLTIKIDPLPAKPSIPSGLEVLCNNTANVSYSTIAIPYTNSYNWNIYPTNAGIINNFGTNAIVNWNNYFTGLANISVKTINNCGISEASDSLTITINSRPSNPMITNGPVSVKTDTALFSNYTAYSNYSDSIIWWIEPSEAATLIPFNSNCDVYWNSNFSGNAQLKLKAKNDCGYSDSTVVFNVIILTAIGIENNLEMNLTVFPNPSSSGKFIIRFNQRQILKNTLIKITDQLGRIVFEKEINSTELIGKSIEADISAFSKGIYFLSIGEKTRKIIFE